MLKFKNKINQENSHLFEISNILTLCMVVEKSTHYFIL